MKRYLIFIFWLLCLSSQAQVNQAQIDAIIPKEKVKTGITTKKCLGWSKSVTGYATNQKEICFFWG